MTAPVPMYVCVDIICYSRKTNEVLFVKRKNDPYKDCLAFPGGYVDPYETVSAAAERELREETGVIVKYLQFFDEYSRPDRDPRGRVVSLVYYKMYTHKPDVIARDDASVAVWKSLRTISKELLAFDHMCILKDFHGKFILPRYPDRDME